MSLNIVILTGRLGQDPELKYSGDNQAVCNLRVATDESYKDKSGARQEKTEWHNVVVFGATAENVTKFLAKGREVAVQGRLQTRTWDDKDGNKRRSTEIVADRVVFIGGKGGGKGAEQDAGVPF